MEDYFNIRLEDDDLKKISTLGLAHIGDAVYELLVRSWLCAHGKATSYGLHRSAVRYVSAPAQAASSEKIFPFLTEREQSVFKRGRNTQMHSAPKNATPGEYARATGLETLFGELYLRGLKDRINELFVIIMDDESI